MRTSTAGDEFLDLAEDRIPIPDEWEVVLPVQLYEAGLRDVVLATSSLSFRGFRTSMF
ncbi:MAG: hypothetical protein M3277_12630 [Actinomycetota bacterium]|nr:hypothetical protein [Actinomycetota bacterium]